MSSIGRALEVVHDRDPRTVLMERAKPLADTYDVFGDDALIAVYTRGDSNGEAKTKGGIITIAKTNAEDLFQGKTGLLMKVGPQFYTDDNAEFFGENAPKVGDWVTFRTGDTYSFKIKDQLFRTCEAKQLRGKVVSSPDIIW